MRTFRGPVIVALLSLALAACGGSDTQTSVRSTSAARGTLVDSPPLRIASLDGATFAAQLGSTSAGATLLQITTTPTCGVDFYYLKYMTVGASNESTESSGALMVPTGSTTGCSGPRPILLYAHGTQTNKLANIADITDATNTEGALIAAMFAAHGYIVVAPNFAGYDISTLGYHPFLNAAQESGEMIDALAAARTALPATFAAATTDSGKLFVSGYSAGGYVAMATVRALQSAGKSVAGSAPMSGPYALEAFGDAVFFGNVNLGSTIFAPLITTSYQHAYGNIYAQPSDLYAAPYANGIETVLPSAMPSSTWLLPTSALFDSTTPVTGNSTLDAALALPSGNSPLVPLFQAGFGNPYLINNAYRVSYALDAVQDPDGTNLPAPFTSANLAAAAPTQTLRKAFYLNDLRNGSWAPASPMLMCGGSGDPTVFFSVNTDVMAQFWTGIPTVQPPVDVDPAGGPSGPWAALQTQFQGYEAQQLAADVAAAGGSQSAGEIAWLKTYHGAVAPFCAFAARAFFSQL